MSEKITGKNFITPKSMDIVLNDRDWDWDDFNPVVYYKEPYDIDTYANEVLGEYLGNVQHLLNKYQKTGDIRYYNLAQFLLPAGMKIQSS